MSTDPTALILSQLAGNAGNGEAPATVNDAILQLTAGDPMLAAAAQLILNRQAAKSPDEDDGDPGERALAQRQVRFLSRRLKDLYQELQVLRERNDRLAGALGACYLCWGDDKGCPNCAGTGRSGWVPPDRRLFALYVAPVQPRRQSDNGNGQVHAPEQASS